MIGTRRSPLALLVLIPLLLAHPARGEERFLPEVRGSEPLVGSGADLDGELGRRARERERPFWVGYVVPKVSGTHQLCCYVAGEGPVKLHGSGSLGSDGVFGPEGVCRLEGDSNWVLMSDEERVPDDRRLIVLLRFSGGQLERVRPASARCTLRTGGLPLHWLHDVDPADSVRWLSRALEDAADEERVADPALSTIALHDTPAADAVVAGAATGRRGGDLRESAIFWLGEARGAPGFQVLRRLATRETDEAIRSAVPFGLAESDQDGATELLIRMARRDPSPEVREQALFWMAQRAGARVLETLTDALANDPEADVQRAAVQGLAHLPDAEGIPLLIDLVRNHRSPQVRREAIFWLAESGDPRALDLIEEILEG